MKFGKLRWFIGKSSSLKLTVICRRSHRTKSFIRGIVSFSSESFKFIRKNFFIIFDIMTRDDICSIQDLDDFFYIVSNWRTINDIFIINTIYLRSSKWDRNRRFNKKIMAIKLFIFSIFILTLYRGKLYDIWLASEITSLRRKSRCFCIPNTDSHKNNLFMSINSTKEGNKNISKQTYFSVSDSEIFLVTIKFDDFSRN